MGGANSVPLKNNPKLQQRNRDLASHLGIIDVSLLQLKVDEDLLKQIVNSSATQLVKMLNEGSVNSQQITAAYAKRAGTIGAQLCLITEDNFVEAMRKAAQLDDLRNTSGKKNWTLGNQYDLTKFLPPLFGVPISVKDTIEMKGFAATIGLIKRANRVQEQDGTIMQAVRNSGQIPLVRTNVPQLAMTFESNNNLWGRAVNPWNTQRSVGGSSGGEGALIAARGSPLGIGSDIGGSIRIPAQFCGICALKPAEGRLSFGGHTPYSDSLDGNPIVPAIMGPMARAVDDLFLWMKSATDKSMYNGMHDPRVYYPNFDEKKYIQAQEQKYRIGVLRGFDIIQPTKASQRAVQEAVDALKQIGHELVQIKMPNEKQVIQSFLTFLLGEGDLASYREMLEGQPFIPEYKQMAIAARLSAKCSCLFKCLKEIVGKFQPRVGWSLGATQKRDTYQYLLNAGSIKKHREQWFNYLRKEKIDFVIAPGFGSQATLNGTSADCSLPPCYTYCWNLLDVPAGSIPITLVRGDEQIYESSHNDLFTKALKKNAWSSQGLPAGIQVIGFPFDQERVLGIMKSIESQVKFIEKYGGPKV